MGKEDGLFGELLGYEGSPWDKLTPEQREILADISAGDTTWRLCHMLQEFKATGKITPTSDVEES